MISPPRRLRRLVTAPTRRQRSRTLTGAELREIAHELDFPDHFLVGRIDVELDQEELGRGSEAAVYRVKWHGAWVAAKVLHPLLIEPGNDGRRHKITCFLRECAMLKVLAHPHVIQCMGVGYTSDGLGGRKLVILTELMDASLKSRFSTPVADSLCQCLIYLRDIAAGLAFLHSQGIIHRDVKPDNCLIRSGRAKLGDVGVAKQLDGDDLGNNYYGTRVPGTMLFMPPEAFEEDVPYGTPLDVFSFAVAMLCVFIRRNPDRQLLLSPRHARNVFGLEQEIPEIERRRADMSLLPAQHCSRPLIVRCIANDPTDRPSTDAVVAFLEARLEEVEVEAEAQERERNALAPEGLQVSLSEVQEQQTQFQEQMEERFQQQFLQIQQSAQRQERGLERFYEAMTSNPMTVMGGMRRQYRGPLFPRREQEDFSDWM